MDAGTNQASYFIGRIGYTHASDYFPAYLKSAVPSLKTVHQAILLDRKFQAKLLEYIGLFELQFRSQLAYFMSNELGAFAHRDPQNFKNQAYFDSFLNDYQREFNRQLRNRNRRVTELHRLYGDVPIWQAVEIMTFGTLSKLYKNTRSKAVRIGVADSFGVKYETLTSWMQTISYARNRCAHFGKLLGTRLVTPPRSIEGITLKNSHPLYIVLILEKLLSTDTEFADDASLMYAVNLAVEMANLFEQFEREIAARTLPPNWRALITDKNIVGAEINLPRGTFASVEVIAVPK